MKRLNNLYKQTYELNNIIRMTDKVLKTVRNKRLVNDFETYKVEHIINIKQRLENETKLISKYNIFLIKDPKYRIIMSLNIEDKIINHLIAKYILEKTFENKFTDNMVATRLGKGTSYGIKLFRKYLNINEKKTNIYNIKNGVEFLGYNFFVKNNKIIIKIKNGTKKRFKKKTKHLRMLKNNNYIDNETYKKLLSSYKGLLKYKYCRRLFISSLKL